MDISDFFQNFASYKLLKKKNKPGMILNRSLQTFLGPHLFLGKFLGSTGDNRSCL